MTTPAPHNPVNGPQDVTSLLQQLNTKAAGTTSSAKASNLYGLGVWGSQTVNPGDLPFLTAIVGQGKTTTGDQLMKAFLSAPADQAATIQHALFMGGFYTGTYTPTWGNVSTQDREAFARAVTFAGQSGASVSDLLMQHAAYGAQAGLAAAQQQTQTGKVAQVNLPNTTDLEALAVQAFNAALGHNASPKNAAKFAAIYRAMSAGVQRNTNQQLYDATNPPAAAPTVDVGQSVQAALVGPNAGDSTAAGNLNPNVTGGGGPPDLAGNLNPNVNQGGSAQPAAPASPSFSDQVGNLMTLGQAIAANPGSAQPPGLTQISTESPVSPDVAAANYARNTHPRQAAANDLANTFQIFLGLLSGVGG